MKTTYLIGLLSLTAIATCAYGQSVDGIAPSQASAPARRAPMYNALFVLRSDVKTIELDPRRDGVFDISAIDPKFVKYVTILKDKEAKRLYGHKGSNGVVIVQFSDDYVLTRENFVRKREP